MTRSHLIRLYPNKKQLELLAKTAGSTRYCYNWGLAKWLEMYRNKERCDQYLLSRLWTKERPEWAKETSRDAQTQAFLNLGGAFSAFFRGEAGYPKFHKKGSKDSFYVPNTKAWFRGDYKIHLPLIGDVRLAEKLRFSGKIMRFCVSRKAKYWYIGITVELDTVPPVTNSTTAVGVDVGAKHLAVTSDGEYLDLPKKIKVLEARRSKYQRLARHRKTGSRNAWKAAMRVSRVQKRIHDIKLDAVHKFTTRLTKNHGIVCCETLHVTGMGKAPRKRKRSLHRAVRNSLMFGLREQLSYKAKNFVKIDRFFPSSKRCSNCGHVLDTLTLDTRTYHCPACGFSKDRDLNAAINILKEGLRVYTEGHSGSACRGCVGF